jgi:hypothetical protein
LILKIDYNNNYNYNYYKINKDVMENKFECSLCYRIFKTKQLLNNHENLKNKCNTVTDFQCNKCLKYLKSRRNLNQHVCKLYNKEKVDEHKKEEENKVNNTNNTDSLKVLLSSTLPDNIKISMINTKYNISIENISSILNSNEDLDTKILLIKEFSTNTTTTVINNDNSNNIMNNTQTTNNIQINTFGRENLSYLDDNYFSKLLINNNIEKAYLMLTKYIYLRLDHPENRNIKVDNINNKYAYVFEKNKWRGILKSELKEILHRKNKKIIKIHAEKLNDILDDAKKNSIRIFFTRLDDKVINSLNDEMILLFYSKKVV